MNYRLENITPDSMRCGIGACPAIFKSREGTYVLIGKRVDLNSLHIAESVASDEAVVEVPKELLENIRN